MKNTKLSSLYYNAKLLVLCIPLLLSACTLAYKSTGDILIGYAEEHGISHLLASDDAALGCAMSEAFAPFLLSFSQVTTSPDNLAILFYLMAGNCSEFKAWEEELRYLRAIYVKNPSAAEDARIAQQRFLHQAAHRQLQGYYFLTQAIAEPGGQCPDLAAEDEQLYWLIGLINGAQAIMNDVASGGHVNVSLDIAGKVARGAECLVNEKWWGVPMAIQAAIRVTMPSSQEDNQQQLQHLQQAIRIGLQQGMRIPLVLAAQTHLGLGDTGQVKNILRQFTLAQRQLPDNQTYKILNEIARLQIQAISDRLWTEATGKRTPIGKLGKFWDDPKKPVDTIDIEAFL
jgi:hypothetical protein